MIHHIERSAPVTVTPRVLQVSGMFDVPVQQRMTSTWDVDLPIGERDWNVGLVVGPSGSGKTSLVVEVWPYCDKPMVWTDRAMIDDFPSGIGIRELVSLLTSVGLGSPPAWLRPYSTLSTGEAFRAAMARRLAGSERLVVVDEFSSTVDRQVAKIVSHAVQKTVRRTDRQLVAVTCHYDVIEWLQPDWIYDTAVGSTGRRADSLLSEAGPCLHQVVIT